VSSTRWINSLNSNSTVTISSAMASATYYEQYLQTLSYSVIGGGSGYSAPTFTANAFGSSTPQVLTTSATGYWFDNSASWTVTNPLGGSSGSEQWITSQSTSGTILSAQTLAFSYQHQFYLSLQAGIGGSVAPASGWGNSGANVTITATPNGGYVFTSWTCTGASCYAGTNNPGSVMMNAAITETASFNPTQVAVTSRVISSTNCGTSCGSGNNVTGSPPAINVNTEYWFSTVVGDTGGLTDVDHVVIYVYKTGITKTTFDQQRAYSFRWVRQNWAGSPSCSTSGGCWQELTGAGTWSATLTYLISADSTCSTIGAATSGTWTFAIKLSQLAQFTGSGAPAHWNYEADIQNIASTLASRSGQLDVNLYMQIATASLNIANVTVTPGATNASLATTSWSYVSNAPLNAQVQANGLPTNGFGDTIPISSVIVGQVSSAGSCTSSTCTKLSLTLQNYATNQPVQASPTLTVYWYISPPNPMVPGTYTFTYTLNLQWTGTYPS
jgi:hypothetical protein